MLKFAELRQAGPDNWPIRSLSTRKINALSGMQSLTTLATRQPPICMLFIWALQHSYSYSDDLYNKFIIDHYDNLPYKTAFVHGHSRSWHQHIALDDLLNNLDWTLGSYFSLTDARDTGTLKLVDHHDNEVSQ